ncbi:MAG: M28 family peptidase [bacterium]
MTLFGVSRFLAGCLAAFLLLLLGTPLQAQQAPEFDGNSAFTFLYRQVALGPRVAESDAHAKAVEMYIDWFRKAGAAVRVQKFPATLFEQPDFTSPARQVQGENVIARFGTGDPTLLLCAHYDTRPWADEDPNPANHMTPVPGANDGASGVAVLLEMARLFSKQPPPITVELVLFDLEDTGISGSDASWALGSQYYALNYAGPAPRGGVLLDMIGDSDLHIQKEYFSAAYAAQWVDLIFNLAAEVDAWAFDPSLGQAVYDDHVPLLKAGIPMVDLIDFDYAYWHTIQDVPAACSPESLEQVGRLLVHLVYGSVLR